MSVVAGLALACGPGKPADTDDGGETGDTSGAADPTTTGVEPTGGATEPGDSGTTAGPDEGRLCVPGRSRVRRLTNAQYRNTVGDLLPGVELPVIDLLSESEFEGFVNIADRQDPWEIVGPFFGAAAEAIAAAAAVGQADKFLPCGPDGGPDPAACGHAFVEDFATRAFRRPLSDAEKSGLLATFDEALAAGGFLPAIEATLVAVLKSETFLHLGEVGGAPVDGQPELQQLTGFELASRMSYFLWDSMPDAELFAAAAQGSLDTPDGAEQQARRLLASPRARAAYARYAMHWLSMHHILSGANDPFSEEWLAPLRPSLRAEIERFVGHVVFDGERTLQSLLTAKVGFVDAALAELYEVPAPADGFAQVELDPAQRPGLLTRAGWLTHHIRQERHSPFFRGYTIMGSLFCMELPPPPPDVPIEPSDDLPENPTTRELWDTILAEPSCVSCHQAPHGLGYGFENYDFMGEWQEQENGKPVDASGEVDAILDAAIAGPFAGAAALMPKLAQSEVVQRCATRKAYLFALGRQLDDADSCELAQLEAAFVTSQGDLHELMVQIVRSAGFRHRLAE